MDRFSLLSLYTSTKPEYFTVINCRSASNSLTMHVKIGIEAISSIELYLNLMQYCMDIMGARDFARRISSRISVFKYVD